MRNVRSSDYDQLAPLINEWWGGRQMSDLLPKLFFDHFQPTSFVIEKENNIIGFLIGFLSQSNLKEAYIHFVGVHPEFRQHNVGSSLYERFFKAVTFENRDTVRAVTSPVNKASIAYHTKMGFEIVKGDRLVDRVPVHSNYDGEGKDRVLFVKKLRDE